jgi:hypothetical protein
LRGSKGVGVTIESYEKVEISYSPVVPEICRGQVHGPRKERRRRRRRIGIRIIIRKIIIRNGAKTNKAPKLCLGDLSPLEEQFCVFKISRCLPKYGIKNGR